AKDGAASAKAPDNPETAEQAAPKAEQAAPKALTAAKATDQAPQAEAPAAAVKKPPDPDKVEKQKPPDPAQVKKPVKLQEAKRLFSSAATGDPIATIAMANIPRGVRVGRLCGTELREQLLNATPPYLPDFLPIYQPGAGTTIEIRSAAFST